MRLRTGRVLSDAIEEPFCVRKQFLKEQYFFLVCEEHFNSLKNF